MNRTAPARDGAGTSDITASNSRIGLILCNTDHCLRTEARNLLYQNWSPQKKAQTPLCQIWGNPRGIVQIVTGFISKHGIAPFLRLLISAALFSFQKGWLFRRSGRFSTNLLLAVFVPQTPLRPRTRKNVFIFVGNTGLNWSDVITVQAISPTRTHTCGQKHGNCQ